MNQVPVTWLVDRLDLGACGRDFPSPVALCWITSLAAIDALRAQGQAPLSATDYREFADRADAAERLARRRMAKVLLGLAASCSPADVVITRTEPGGPEVRHPPGWHLSVGGRWPYLAIGVARVPLGVDLELVTEPAPPDDCFSAAELRALRDGGPDQRLRWWCAKEAHAKLTGRARQMSPADIVIAPAAEALRGQSAQQSSRILTWANDLCVVAVATGPA